MTQTAIRAEEVTWTDATCPVARTLDLIGEIGRASCRERV